MLELPGVTLVCIDATRHALALAAIEQSVVRCRFESAVFVTDRAFDIPELRVVESAAIGTAEERERFILTALHRHIKTPHVLLVAWDAFPVNGAAWDDAFLRFDCIAPPPAPGADSIAAPGDGILLLSRRLLEPGPASVLPPNPASGAVSLRARLESDATLRAAPRALAERFAFGDDYPVGETFGFAGLRNMWMFFQPPDLRALLDMAAPVVLRSPGLAVLGSNLRVLGRHDEANMVSRAMAGADLAASPAGTGAAVGAAIGAATVAATGAATGAATAAATAAVPPHSPERTIVGRNDPCPCGSGQKFKQCHGRIGAAMPVPSTSPPDLPPFPQSATAPTTRPAAPAATTFAAAPPPPDLAALLHLARTAFVRNDIRTAGHRYRSVLERRPEDPVALEYLGVIATHERRFDAAGPLLSRALVLRPHAPEFHSNLGLLHQARGDFDLAIQCYRDALSLDPAYAPAHNNLGLALQEQQDVRAAIDAFRAAVLHQPEFAEAHWNLSLALLLAGEFAEGFAEQEWRIAVEKHRAWWARRRQFPMWTGEPVAGKRVLILAEQGMGDMIQFVRYAQPLAARGATVLLEAPEDLADLLRSAPGVAGIVPRDGPYPPCDFQVPVMSLPLPFATTVATSPSPRAYLRADETRRARWSGLLGVRDRPRAGIAWAGNPEHSRDRFRSMPLSAFEPLLAMNAIEWISLQKGGPAAEVAMLPPGCQLRDLTAESRNFADLAALTAELDVVLTVDTSIVHLAGALGVPTLLLLDTGHDWRWLQERTDSIWYPGVRVLRQPVRGDWTSVIAMAAAELRRRFATA